MVEGSGKEAEVNTINSLPFHPARPWRTSS
jgi:hypothetical protein